MQGMVQIRGWVGFSFFEVRDCLGLAAVNLSASRPWSLSQLCSTPTRTHSCCSMAQKRKLIFDCVEVKRVKYVPSYVEPRVSESDEGTQESDYDDEEDAGELEGGQSQASRSHRFPTSVAAIPPPPSTACQVMGFVCTHDLHVSMEGATFPFPLAEPCPILTALGLEYTQWGFLCRMHGCIIHPRLLSHHIQHTSGHRSPGFHFKKAAPRFLEHTLKAYGVPNESVEFPLPHLPRNSIPGLVPHLAYVCPVEGCSTFRGVLQPKRGALTSASSPDHSIWTHVRGDHSISIARQLKANGVEPKTHYILQPYWRTMSTRDKGSTVVLVFHSDFVPPDGVQSQPLPLPATVELPSTCADLSAAPVSAEWLEKLEWGRWLTNIQADLDPLLQLIFLPSSHTGLASWIPSSDPLRLRLEISIFTIHQLVGGYLQDANCYIQDKHGDLRQHIHGGCVLFAC